MPFPAKAGVQEPEAFWKIVEPGSRRAWTPAFAGERST